jgi:homocysteine S-methyltransferase
VYAQAMLAELNCDPSLRGRVLGLQGNTSCRSPEELDGLAFLDTEQPRPFAAAMLALHRRFGAKILGGCCGTDDRHIEWIGRGMVRERRAGAPDRAREKGKDLDW